MLPGHLFTRIFSFFYILLYCVVNEWRNKSLSLSLSGLIPSWVKPMTLKLAVGIHSFLSSCLTFSIKQLKGQGGEQAGKFSEIVPLGRAFPEK